MKILFVCNANVIRSQMAAAFYNYLTGTRDASSAGTGVSTRYPEYDTLQKMADDQTTPPAPERVIQAMREVGIDVANSPRMQLAPTMTSEYDVVVDLTESVQRPDWLIGENVIWWDVIDPRKDGTFEQIVTARDEIENRVKQLVEVINSGGDPRELNDNIDKEEN